MVILREHAPRLARILKVVQRHNEAVLERLHQVRRRVRLRKVLAVRIVLVYLRPHGVVLIWVCELVSRGVVSTRGEIAVTRIQGLLMHGTIIVIRVLTHLGVANIYHLRVDALFPNIINVRLPLVLQ